VRDFGSDRPSGEIPRRISKKKHRQQNIMACWRPMTIRPKEEVTSTTATRRRSAA